MFARSAAVRAVRAVRCSNISSFAPLGALCGAAQPAAGFSHCGAAGGAACNGSNGLCRRQFASNAAKIVGDGAQVAAQEAVPENGAENGAGEAAEAAEGDTTHFGFKTIGAQEKEGMVGEIFTRVADKYDVMNDVMSMGMHRLWKDEFVSMMGPFVSRTGETRVLDVAGGTGDTAFRIVDAIRKSPVQHATSRSEVVVCDINAAMLEVGKQRAIERGYADGKPAMQWVEGNAEELPFHDNTFDAYTITFGIRNVTNVQNALHEAYRVLKPGGRFMCLEFSHVHWPVLQDVYDEYSFKVIPAMGELVASDRDSYQYLVESIRKFPEQDEFVDMISHAGFKLASYTNFTGGVVAVHSGFKL